MTTKEIKERFAALEHQRWSNWMKYLFTKGKVTKEGHFQIDKIFYEWWEKESKTPYSNLQESQKISDRKEVGKYFIYYNHLLSRIKELEDGIKKHYSNNFRLTSHRNLVGIDLELYKLLEEV